MGKSLTDEEFNRRVNKDTQGDYTFLEPYIGRHNKILCRHNTCGYEWKVEPGAFLGNKNKKGSRCPYCEGNALKTTEQYKKEVKKLTENSYEVLGSYKNSHTKIKMKHKSCGTIYMIEPNSFMGGTRCPFCNPTRPYDTEKARVAIQGLADGSYILSGGCNGFYEDIEILHKKCGKTFTSSMMRARRGLICPYCFNRSKGEFFVRNYLEINGYHYEIQKRFEGIKKLSYDFYLPEENIVIEYQGEQHYKPVKLFGGEESFERQKNIDKMKRDYAEDKGINLVEISYKNKTQTAVSSELDLKLSLVV